jgi:hypothetical protein
VSELPWNPYPQQDWRQMGGQPPYQGEPYRTAEDQLAPPEPDAGHEPPGPPGPPPPRRNRHTVRNILAGIGILAVAGLVISALASKGTGASTAGSHSSASAPATVGAAGQPTVATPSPALGQPTGPGVVGSSFNVYDSSKHIYQVTLVKVIDPAKSADQFVTLDRGTRLVGIVFRITALSGSPQGEDADNDCTVVGNDGKVYTAVFESIVGYTNFEVGVIHAAQGATVEGAVTFQLPQYTEVVAVHWVASDGLGTSVMWDIG